MKWRSNSTAD